VEGEWKYLYCAVDKYGETRDCSESTGLLPEDVYRKIRV
jgi:hypothetical protein